MDAAGTATVQLDPEVRQAASGASTQYHGGKALAEVIQINI